MVKYYEAFPEGEVRKMSMGQMFFITLLLITIVGACVNLSKMPWEVKAASAPRKCTEVDLTISGIASQHTSGFGSTEWKVNGVLCEKVQE